NYYDPDGKLDTFCGSPPYAAPELFQGKRYTGPEVDVWSLGVILYVLTTGCLPFDGKNLQEMRESVCRGKYRIPFYLSDVCEKLLRKFLIRDPYKRSNLDFLNDDPWINEGYAESPIARDISTKVQEDETIIKLLETKYNIAPDAVYKCLRENIYDDVAAMYYLLYYDKEAKSRRSSEQPGSGVPSIQIPSSSTSPPIASPVEMAKSASAAVPPTSTSTSSTSTSKPDAAAPVKSQLRPQQAGTTDKKRRFTVGSENDAAKLSDESETPKTTGMQQIMESIEVNTNALGARQVPMDTSRLNNAQSSRDSRDQGANIIPTIDIQDDPTGGNIGGAGSKMGHSMTMSVSPSAFRKDGLGGSAQNTKDGSTEEVGNNGRKRGNTIVGLFRNIRRTSDVTAMAPLIQNLGKNTANANPEGPRETMATVAVDESMSTIDTMMSQLKTEDNKPRSLRFTFNSSTTSSKPPDEIVKGVVGSLEKHSVTFRTVTPFLLECFWANPTPGKDGVKFEIEVCKLPRLKNLHGLRFKRLAGSSTDYKDICEKVFGSAGL
ncbi:Serine/threonine-protein kinase par-1, partial [Rhizoclosmatium hyalinum]